MIDHTQKHHHIIYIPDRRRRWREASESEVAGEPAESE
jgi:hypothetical protein